MSIETLRREVRRYRTMALDIYDQLSGDQTARDALAHVLDNRRDRDNPYRLEEMFHFPEVYAWEDHPTSTEMMDRIEFVVPMRGYSAFVPWNAVNIGRPSNAAQLEEMVRRLPPAYLRSQTRAIMEVFRRNPISYTGQDFFSQAHPHPGEDHGLFSNVLPLNFANPAVPTPDEIKDLLDRVLERFAVNLNIESEVLMDGQVRSNLLVIVHNPRHYSQFRKVREKARFGLEENEHQNTFEILVDRRPSAGQENWIEFVHRDGEGPRPAFLILDRDPRLGAAESDRVEPGYAEINYGGIYGVKPAFPQSSLQGGDALLHTA